MDESLKMIDRVGDTLVDMTIRFAPKLFVAALILVAGYFIGRWAARMLSRSLARFHLEPPVRMLVQRVIQLVVLALFLILALQNLGIELLPLIAGLGVAGAGVALAMQGVLGNLAAGLTIIFTRPFRVGEYISIVNEEGTVLEITLFNTTLGHTDLSRVVIPNRKIVGEILHNCGTIRQVSIEVSVPYESDVGAALRSAQEVLDANPRVLRDPKAGVGIARLGDSGAVIGLWPWVKAPDYVDSIGEVNAAVLDAFRQRGIAVAAPQREIRVVSATAGLRGGSAEGLAGRNAA